MAQRRTYTKSSVNRSRQSSSSYRKPSSTKYQSSRNQKRPSGGGAKIILVLLLVVIVVGGIIIITKNLPTAVNNDPNTMIEGISIDGINVAGLSKDEAYYQVEQASAANLNNISITFRYNDKSWAFTGDELQAAINAQSIVDQAFEVGKAGTSKENRQVQEETKNIGLPFKTEITVDKDVLIEALKDVKKEIDQPMVESAIAFDPSNFNGVEYIADRDNPNVDMTKDMFTLTLGTVGYVMDYDKAIQELNDALVVGWTADINLSVKEEHPKYTVEELEECTTLIFHSSSKITSSSKKNANRNSNIGKAIGFYKGIVVWPGDIIDYNQILGERLKRDGWLEAPTITQEKTLVDALGGGICQASTTIYNAAFMVGAKIIDRGPHSWPAYYKDFGYGMDAMVNWDTDEFIFTNNSDYPIFINTYFVNDSYGTPSFIDVDIFSMPQKDENGNVLHIRPESTTIRRDAAPSPIYREDTENQYVDKTWKVDTALNKEIYVHRNSKELVEISVDTVWYKDCVETAPGVFEGGVEVKREHSHIDLYTSVAAIIYTRPLPEPTASPTPSPAPT